MADAFGPHSGDMIVNGDENGLDQTPHSFLGRRRFGKRRFGKPRVKKGCANCRLIRVKCDGSLPSCTRCLKAKRTCPGYPPTPGSVEPYAEEQHDPDEPQGFQAVVDSIRTRKASPPRDTAARKHRTPPTGLTAVQVPVSQQPQDDPECRRPISKNPKPLLKYDIWKTSTSPVDIPDTSPAREPEKVLLSKSLPESVDASLSRCFLEQCRLDKHLDDVSPKSSEVSWISRWWSSTDNNNNTSYSTCQTEDSSLEQAPVTSESGLSGQSPSSWKQELFNQKRRYVSTLSTMLRNSAGPQPLCPPKHDIRAVIATARKIQPTLGRLAHCSGQRKVQSCPTPRVRRLLDEASLSPSSASLPRPIPRPRNQTSPTEATRCAASKDESMDTLYTSTDSGPITGSLCSSSSTPGLVSREEQKSILLGRLMDYFFAALANGPRNGDNSESSQQASSSSSANALAPTSSAKSSVRRGPTRKGKRSASPEDHGSDDDENEGPRAKKVKTEEPEVKRLACPFFKRDPHRYKDQSKCVGPGWTTVHRLKEHLYRRHRLPVHCLRCHDVFPNDQGLKKHSRSQAPCQRTAGAKILEGITSSQERQLRSRKRSDRTEEKWRDVYRICFPVGEDEDPAPVPSPYFELPSLTGSGEPGRPSDMARYDEYMARELPRRVKRALELRIEEEFSPVEERLRSQLPDIVRGLYQALSEDFRRSLGASPGGKETVEGQEHDIAKLTNAGDVKGKGKMVVAAGMPGPMVEMEHSGARSDCFVDEPSVYGDWEANQPINVLSPLQPYYGGDLAGLDSWMRGVDGRVMKDCRSWPDAGYLSGAMLAVSNGMLGDNGCDVFGNEVSALQVPCTGDNGAFQDGFSLP